MLDPMARPLRMELPGGRYHVTARGNDRTEISRDDRARLHFLTLLGELPGRFGARLHAYVLMDNHYHLLLETPEDNLSRAMQWLNVSYSTWFNVAPIYRGGSQRAGVRVSMGQGLGRHGIRSGRWGELAQRVGCDFTTVGKAMSRFGQWLKSDKKLAQTMEKLKG